MASIKTEKPVGSQPAVGQAKKEPPKAPGSGQAPKKVEPKKKVQPSMQAEA